MSTVFYSDARVDSDAFILAAYKAYCQKNEVCPLPVEVDRSSPKPRLSYDGRPISTCFSLSHSGKYIVCAVSEVPVGVDIQQKKPLQHSEISERFFGEKIADPNNFFDEFCKGEATAKRYEIPLVEGLRRREGRAYDFFDGYSFAICGDEEAMFYKLRL